MRKYIAVAGLLALVSTTAWSAESPVSGGGEGWRLGWLRNEKADVFREYIVDEKDPTNRSELMTTQFYAGLQNKTSPEKFEAQVKKDLLQACPGAKWTSVSHKKNERLWSWSVAGCPGEADRSELARLVSAEKGMHIFRYSAIGAPMPEAKKKAWLKKLGGIKISKE